jgi:hypothetical protein
LSKRLAFQIILSKRPAFLVLLTLKHLPDGFIIDSQNLSRDRQALKLLISWNCLEESLYTAHILKRRASSTEA